ncbi:MAG: response regulator, partial [Oscillospiraceae bacterium]|nr:response regulator [Oscillospiraceae bacterium]
TSIVNSRIGSKEIEFTMDISPDLPKSLYGDSVRIHQIVLNLLTNAVKFTHHGEVHFKIDFELKDEDTVVMKAEVSDTGIGIKKEDMHKLFNSFQQVDSKRNRNIEGTGLGLAITRQLLDLMGGKISVESEYEKGTKFYFEVPQKIVDATPIVPKLKKSFKTAVLVSNDYVKRQIIRDLNWIGAEYTDLADKSSYKDLRVDYLIVEKLFFTKTIKDVLAKYPDMQCLVLADYDSLDAIDIPNVRVISKPVYSLSLYNAMGIQEISFEGGISEGDSFTFVAPDAHILVVDDNAVNLTVAKGLLEPLNMTIDLASSAAEAIEKIHYTQYDLIFMDHMMPEVDGVEATHIIRRLVPSYKDVPIIALTANAIGGAKEMFLKEGMNDFIAKPIDVKDTVSKLRKWLPKEKILSVDKPDIFDSPAQDTTGSGSGSDAVNIKELNTKEAISRLGSEKLFWSVLKEYFCAIDKKYSAILEHKEAERWRDYTIEVHALKSTSRQIGAEHISEIAAEMEKAGNEGNIALINEKTAPLLEEYLQLKEALKPYFADASEDEERFAQVEEILAMLEKMQTALDQFDTLQIDEVIEEMSKFRYPDENELFFEQLKKSAEESNIDDCLNIVNQWGTVLVKSVSDGDKVIHMLGDLQDALDKFDTLEVDAVIEKMAKNSFPYSGLNKSYFQSLQEAAKNGDFEMCAEIADHWSRAIVDIYI